MMSRALVWGGRVARASDMRVSSMSSRQCFGEICPSRLTSNDMVWGASDDLVGECSGLTHTCHIHLFAFSPKTKPDKVTSLVELPRPRCLNLPYASCYILENHCCEQSSQRLFPHDE